MPSRIGVVIQARDGAAVGLRRCIELAQRVGGSLHVIDVAEPAPRWLSRGRGGHITEEQRIQERRALLERFVSNVTTGGIDVTVAVRRGRRIVEPINEVRDASADLVVLVSDDAKQSPTTAEAFANKFRGDRRLVWPRRSRGGLAKWLRRR